MNTDIYVTGAGGSRGTPCARGPLMVTAFCIVFVRGTPCARGPRRPPWSFEHGDDFAAE